MASDLISYLFEEKFAEFAQEKAAMAKEQAVLIEERAAMAEEKSAWQRAMQQAVEDVIIARFPDVPARLTRQLRRFDDPARLQQLLQAILAAPDLATVERLMAEA